MLDTYNDNNFNSNNPDNFPESEELDLDYSLIDNIIFGGIDFDDYPDFCDAYIESADYDGVEMTEAQLEIINDDIGYWHDDIIQSCF
jgi:hypothetical protein